MLPRSLMLANSRIPNVSNFKSLFQRPLVIPQPLPLWSIWAHSQRIPRFCRRVQQVKSWETSWPLTIWSQDHFGRRHRSTFRPYLLLIPGGTCHSSQVHRREPCYRVHPSLTLPVRSSSPFHPEKRWFSSALHWLPRPQPDLKEGSLSTSAHFWSARCTTKSTSLY